MKKLLSVAAVALLSSSAHAAFQVVALPALPSMPLNAPSALPSRPVSLPSVSNAPTLLPGVSNLPKIAPSLPALPIPVIGTPRIGLPNPVNPLPVTPTALVRAPKLAAVATIRLAAPAAEKDDARREKLERIFDRGETRDPRQDPRDEGRHTLPENDLLNEIGVQSY